MTNSKCVPRGRVYGTGPDYRIRNPGFYEYKLKSFDKVHTYTKAHEHQKVYAYNNHHSYDTIKEYSQVREYKVKEYKPNFYKPMKPEYRKLPPIKIPKTDSKNSDYKWAQLYMCYKVPTGPEIQINEYRVHEYKIRQYIPVMTEYIPPKIDYMSRSREYHCTGDYKLTNKNYYPFMKRNSYSVKRKKLDPVKENSTTSLQQVDVTNTNENMSTPVVVFLNENKSTLDSPREDSVPASVKDNSIEDKEKENTFVNEAERHTSLAVGTSVAVASTSTGTDDLKVIKRTQTRWTQTTPVTSPEPFVSSITPVNKAAVELIGVPNKTQSDTPVTELTPEPDNPHQQHESEAEVISPHAVIAGEKIKQKTPSPSPKPTEPRERNSPNILPGAGVFAAGAVVIANNAKEKSPSPVPNQNETSDENNDPSPEVEVPLVIAGLAVKNQSPVPSAKSKTPSPSPSVSLKSLENESWNSESLNEDTSVLIAAAAVNNIPTAKQQRSVAENINTETQDTAKGNDLNTLTIVSTPTKTPIPKAKTPEEKPKTLTPTALTPEEEPKSGQNNDIKEAILPVPPENIEQHTKENSKSDDVNSRISSSSSKKGLPPEVVASIEAYDKAHTSDAQVYKQTFSRASVASVKSNIPPEVIATIEAYIEVRKNISRE